MRKPLPKCTHRCQSNPSYILSYLNDRPFAITCLCCNMASGHPMDIGQRYCGWCHIFHELFMERADMALPFRTALTSASVFQWDTLVEEWTKED